MNKPLIIGLFGYGCVGKGLYDTITLSGNSNTQIAKICVKDKNKQRDIPENKFTYNKEDLLNDPEINVIVELINDSAEALEIVSAALKNGKAVVTANKKLIAENFLLLHSLSVQTGTPLLYEAAVGGSIPIIRSLEQYYNTDNITRTDAILNGTTNYILSRMTDEKKSYGEALALAQKLGFAELDPTLDVQAFDPKFKLCILLIHAFGLVTKPDDIFNYGIQNLSEKELQFATEKKLGLRLLAHAAVIQNKVEAWVMPAFISKENAFNSVTDEFNSIVLQAKLSALQQLTGKGAGRFPTSAAVLSDIAALTSGYMYHYTKLGLHSELSLNNQTRLRIYLRYTDSTLLNELNFIEIEEEYVSRNYSYVIGTLHLEELIRINPNTRPDLFIAYIPEAVSVTDRKTKENIELQNFNLCESY